jgi:H+/Cl- antiporter ClcA
MNWFNRHLHWTYTIVLVVSLAILIATIPHYLIIGISIFVILNLAAGAWVLRRKGQSLWYLVLAVLFYLLFVLAVIYLKNKRTAPGNEISDAAYYEKR